MVGYFLEHSTNIRSRRGKEREGFKRKREEGM